MKNIYLIRHGQSEANVDWLILKDREESSIPLTRKGRKDAKGAGQTLKEMLAKESGAPKFFVSPWLRAVQTYKGIAKELGIIEKPTVLPGIVEHHMNLVGNEENWNKFIKFRDSGWSVPEFLETKFDGGESLHDVIIRADKFVQFLSGFPSGPLVVVSHGQFIKMMLAIIDKTDPDKITHPQNGEVIVRSLGISLNSYAQLATYCNTKGYKIVADAEDHGLMKVTNPKAYKRVDVHIGLNSTRQILEILGRLENE